MVHLDGRYHLGEHMSLRCDRCGDKEFRVSQWRGDDFWQLLRLRMPIRCRRCHERKFVSLGEYRKVSRAEALAHAGSKA